MRARQPTLVCLHHHCSRITPQPKKTCPPQHNLYRLNGYLSYSSLGNSLVDQRQLQEAETSFRRAIEVNPKNPHIYHNLALVLAKQGKFQEAEDACRQAIEIDPTYARGHFGLGSMLAEQGNLAKAEESFRKTIKFDPKFLPAYVSLGFVLLQQGKKDVADEMFKRADELQQAGEWKDWRMPIVISDNDRPRP